MAKSPGLANESVVCVHKYGGVERVDAETEKQEHEGERKAHWSPRWPNNDIRKKNYRKVNMKLEKIAGMRKLHAK